MDIIFIRQHTHFYEILLPSICGNGLAYFPQQLHVEVNQQFRNCKNKKQVGVQTSLLQLLSLNCTFRFGLGMHALVSFTKYISGIIVLFGHISVKILNNYTPNSLNEWNKLTVSRNNKLRSSRKYWRCAHAQCGTYSTEQCQIII